MKKLQALFTLTVVTVLTLAQAQQKPISDAELKQIILDVLCTGHVPPIDLNEPENDPTIQDIAERQKIPPARMARVVEEMIRERLPIVEKGEDNDTARMTAFQLDTCIPMLEVFNSTNSLALLEECALSKNRTIRDFAIRSYVAIAEAESIPFVRKAFAEGRIHNRWLINTRLEEVSAKLKKENRTADVEKFATFLKEMKQAEQPKEKGEN